MSIGSVSWILLILNFVSFSIVWLVPQALLSPVFFDYGLDVLRFTCGDGFWVDGRRAVSVALGGFLSVVGIFVYLVFGEYSGRELVVKRNHASVTVACLMVSVAAGLFAFSYFPCNSFYFEFSSYDGIFSHRMGYAVREALEGSWLIFNAFYSLLFGGISYSLALAVKIKFNSFPVRLY